MSSEDLSLFAFPEEPGEPEVASVTAQVKGEGLRAPAQGKGEEAEVTVTYDFQRAASEQGQRFAVDCDELLKREGFELRGAVNLTEIGVEIDQIAISGRTGHEIWFEYKGSVAGSRPGLLRTDTLKKAIANGALLRGVADRPPYVVLASHMPERGAGLAMLDAAKNLGYFDDVVCLYNVNDTARLRKL